MDATSQATANDTAAQEALAAAQAVVVTAEAALQSIPCFAGASWSPTGHAPCEACTECPRQAAECTTTTDAICDTTHTQRMLVAVGIGVAAVAGCCCCWFLICCLLRRKRDDEDEEKDEEEQAGQHTRNPMRIPADNVLPVDTRRIETSNLNLNNGDEQGGAASVTPDQARSTRSVEATREVVIAVNGEAKVANEKATEAEL